MASDERLAPGQIMRSARRARGMTLTRLAELLSCSKSTLSLFETGRRPLSASWAERLESVLEITDGSLIAATCFNRLPDSLRARLEDASSDDQGAQSADALSRLRRVLNGHERREEQAAGSSVGSSPGSSLTSTVEEELPACVERDNVVCLSGATRSVPVINRVAAGPLTEYTDLGHPPSIADAYVPMPDIGDTSAFAATVVGDSMAPQYAEGDIVVFSPARDAVTGCDCYVRFERDAESTFKRVESVTTEGGEERVRLVPLNDAHPVREVRRESIARIVPAGYVVKRIEDGE
ncbi:MAG: XRE family transcriptional regulator [Planctomycetota bacterium]